VLHADEQWQHEARSISCFARVPEKETLAAAATRSSGSIELGEHL
jgi:hypothetical protein